MNNGWTKIIEAQIAEKGNKCGNISMMHEAEADRCHNWSKNLAYLSIFVNFIIALFQIPNIIENNKCTEIHNIWSYLTVTTVAVQLAISGFMQMGNFDEKKSINISAAADFEIMRGGILQQLSRERKNRRPAKEYQKYVDDLYDKSTRYRPYVSRKFRDKYSIERTPIQQYIPAISISAKNTSESQYEQSYDTNEGSHEKKSEISYSHSISSIIEQNKNVRGKRFMKEIHKRINMGSNNDMSDWQLYRFLRE